MSESLVGRVARLVAGTFTSMVDAAESTAPEMVTRQAIEEIDRAIDDVRTEIGRKQAERHNANRELASLNNRGEQVTAQIQTALQEGRDDLAEAGAEELVGIDDRIPIIEALVADTHEQEQELDRYLAGLQSKRDEMEKDLRSIREHKAAQSAPVTASSARGAGAASIDRRVDRAGNAVARAKESVTGIPVAQSGTDAAARAELEALHRKNRVAQRLAALKQES